MLILILSLLLSFIGGFVLAISFVEKKSNQRKLVSSLAPGARFACAERNRTFSLASLVLFVFFPPHETSTRSALED
jgi:hypothetical protein